MYENLMRRAELCEQAGARTTGFMRVMWLINAERLREKALALTVDEA
ncbi:MAG TPA: hypothetical protein PKW41_11105 [Clostridia bacterium]|nr:hypothetical protein [Clostridia bacterium]